VALVNPRIIVTLGRFSMRRWFPNGSITQLHGQVQNIGRGDISPGGGAAQPAVAGGV